jgi:catechol-2,3-dioxygenase
VPPVAGPASRGFADLHAGGRFKHRIGLKTWQGVSAAPPPPGTPRLWRYTIRYDSPARLEQVLERVEVVNQTDRKAVMRDPDGIAIVLTA